MASTRRDALKVFGLGGALVVAAPRLVVADAVKQTNADLFDGTLAGFVRVNPDNTVIIGAPVPDMGTGIETTLPMIVAEELDLDWSDVRVERMPYSSRKVEGRFEDNLVIQGSGGSGSTRIAWPVMRDCGALARDLLVRAAAKRWRVEKDQVSTKGAYLHNKASGAKLAYAAVIDDALKLDVNGVTIEPINRGGNYWEPQVPAESEGGPRRKAVKDYTIVGTEVAQENIVRLVRGNEKFGIDLDIDGQYHAVIERCPYFGGDVKSFDASEALALPGVIKVIKVPDLAPEGARSQLNSPGVAVIAKDLWSAQKARQLLKVEWDEGAHTHEDETWQSEALEKALRENELTVSSEAGDFDGAYEGCIKKMEAVYTTPHFAHMNMEPLTCSAHVESDRVTVKTSHQSPPQVAEWVHNYTGIPVENITVETGRIGCGFGRKYARDFPAEAVYLSQQAGVPVKVFWSREDEVQHDHLNPASRVLMQAGLDENNKLVAWHSCSSSRWPPRMRGFPVGLVPNLKQGYVRCEGAVPLGAWRGPGNNTAGFSVSSFMDEVAHEMGRDPVEVWLELLGEPRELPFNEWIPDARGAGISTGKMAGVIKLAAEKAGWGKPVPEGWGRGIAAHFTFGGYVAFVVDVRHDAQNGLVVENVVGAADCGMIINKLGATAQMESGVHDGLSTVLYQHVRIDGGRITSGNFDDMRLLRMDEAPRQFEMHFVPSEEEPWGTGEMALPAFIPALMNAIFDATGKRVRSLPLGDQLSA